MNIYHVHNEGGYVLATCATQTVAENVALYYANDYYGFRNEKITLSTFSYDEEGSGKAYVLCNGKRRHESEHFMISQEKLIFHEDEIG